jgi:hypothetical protein
MSYFIGVSRVADRGLAKRLLTTSDLSVDDSDILALAEFTIGNEVSYWKTAHQQFALLRERSIGLC